MNSLFPTDLESIYERIEKIDPVSYARNRNFINGSVSYLSPYISRGVISTKFILNNLIERGYNLPQMEKFVQELAWRDYWQQVWIAKKSDINFDLKQSQINVENYTVPAAIINANTGIEAIDTAIKEFYKTGYLHNHLRMYIAAIVCNVAKCHWKEPARWMYYHLLDADWASNALSWQWVAGMNSHKKYIANQENINKYFFTNQTGTFLDVSYSDLEKIETPSELKKSNILDLKTTLPEAKCQSLKKGESVCVYNFYNLDPSWRKEQQVQRVLLLEPSHFEEYSISEQSVQFMLDLAKNIVGLSIYVGEFADFLKEYEPQQVFFKEHPLCTHYNGLEDQRDWLFNTKGYYPSFFAFWNKSKKALLNYEN